MALHIKQPAAKTRAINAGSVDARTHRKKTSCVIKIARRRAMLAKTNTTSKCSQDAGPAGPVMELKRVGTRQDNVLVNGAAAHGQPRDRSSPCVRQPWLALDLGPADGGGSANGGLAHSSRARPHPAGLRAASPCTPGVHHFHSDNAELGTACWLCCRDGCLSITVQGDADIIRSAGGAKCHSRGHADAARLGMVANRALSPSPSVAAVVPPIHVADLLPAQCEAENGQVVGRLQFGHRACFGMALPTPQFGLLQGPPHAPEPCRTSWRHSSWTA